MTPRDDLYPHRCIDSDGDWVSCPDHLCEAWRAVSEIALLVERDRLLSLHERQQRVRAEAAEAEVAHQRLLRQDADSEVAQLRDGLRPENLARLFHETYESLAPFHGYKTRKDSAVSWDEVPAANKALMIATADTVARALLAEDGAAQ